MRKKNQEDLHTLAIQVTNKYDIDLETVLRRTEDTSILEAFRHDWRESLKEEIATNPNTPAEILEILSKDLDNVKIAVAQNASTPIYVLEHLAKYSRSSDVKGIAKSSLRRRK